MSKHNLFNPVLLAKNGAHKKQTDLKIQFLKISLNLRWQIIMSKTLISDKIINFIKK